MTGGGRSSNAESRSVGQRGLRGRHREGVRVTGVELGMRGEHAVREKFAELRLRPPMHDAVNDAMEIRSRVDVVRDARRDDRQDVAGARTAFIEPCEEPVLASEN